jgi:hypothetical protein
MDYPAITQGVLPEMKPEWAKIFIAIFMLFVLVFVIKTMLIARAAYEDRIERLCAPQQESRWAHLAPPMEKNNVRNNTETSTEAMCESRRKSDDSTDSARQPE